MAFEVVSFLVLFYGVYFALLIPGGNATGPEGLPEGSAKSIDMRSHCGGSACRVIASLA
jgi:hypothetical protein